MSSSPTLIDALLLDERTVNHYLRNRWESTDEGFDTPAIIPLGAKYSRCLIRTERGEDYSFDFQQPTSADSWEMMYEGKQVILVPHMVKIGMDLPLFPAILGKQLVDGTPIVTSIQMYP